MDEINIKNEFIEKKCCVPGYPDTGSCLVVAFGRNCKHFIHIKQIQIPCNILNKHNLNTLFVLKEEERRKEGKTRNENVEVYLNFTFFFFDHLNLFVCVFFILTYQYDCQTPTWTLKCLQFNSVVTSKQKTCIKCSKSFFLSNVLKMFFVSSYLPFFYSNVTRQLSPMLTI